MVSIRLHEAASGDDMDFEIEVETVPRVGEIIVLESKARIYRYRIERIEHKFGNQGETPHIAAFVELD